MKLFLQVNEHHCRCDLIKKKESRSFFLILFLPSKESQDNLDISIVDFVQPVDFVFTAYLLQLMMHSMEYGFLFRLMVPKFDQLVVHSHVIHLLRSNKPGRKRPYAIHLRRKTTDGYCNRFRQLYAMFYGILRSSQTLTAAVHRLQLP
jgi:hypothetical protein